jgi:hypothetical protein
MDVPDDADGRVEIFSVELAARLGERDLEPAGPPVPFEPPSPPGHARGSEMLEGPFVVALLALVLVILLVLGLRLTH